MLRVRFKANRDDYRPINWPITHPYWCSGSTGDHSIVIAYADDEEYILKNWPEAIDLDSEVVTKYYFNERFPKPSWFNKETTMQPDDQ